MTVCGYSCGMRLFFFFLLPCFCNKLIPSVMANMISDCVELACTKKKKSGNPEQRLPYVFIIAYSKLLVFIH